MAVGFIEELKREISDKLPTSSGIIGEVGRVIAEPSSSANDLAEILKRDPTLTARILKISNSAYYGSAGTINSLQRAVVVLGFEKIKQMVFTTTVAQNFFAVEAEDDIDRKGLWLHSVGAGTAAELITQEMRIERPDLAYTVALLHDIGKILLALLFPRRYQKIIAMAYEKRCRIILPERKILNVDHAMVGKTLCESWNLPDSISTAILYHHAPMELPRGSQNLAQIVNLADYMARKAGIGDPGDPTVIKPSPAIVSILGTKRDTLNGNFRKIYSTLVQQKNDIEIFFDVISDESHEEHE